MRTLTVTASLLALSLAVPATAALAQTAAPAPEAAPPPALNTSAPTGAPTAVTGGAAPSLTGPSIWGILPWGGFGVGGRFMIPLGIRPLLVNTPVRDSFALDVGADLLHWSYDFGLAGAGGFNYSWTEVLPVAGLMWNIWLNDRFAFYPKVELGYAFGWFSGWDGMNGVSQPAYGGFFWDGAVGAMYKLPAGVTLRAEAGYAGLKLGAGWLF
jgi:hypothetical protein